MADNTAAPHVSESTVNIFDFFALPPEVRDLIYDELAGDEVLCGPNHLPGAPKWFPLYLRLAKFPTLDYQLVSVQFMDDFLKKAMAHNTMVIEDWNGFSPNNSVPLRIPSILHSITSLELRLVLDCMAGNGDCMILGFLKYHTRGAVDCLMNNPNLKKLSIDLYLHCEGAVEKPISCAQVLQREQSKMLSKIAAAAHFVNIQVYYWSRAENDGVLESWNIANDVPRRRLLMKYCHQAGKLVQVDPA